MFASRTIGGVRIPCIAVYVVCVLLIVLYGVFLRRTGTSDILAREFFNHPLCQNVDGWSVTHFLFFGLLGVLYPGRHLQFFTVGVFWEIIETILGQNKLEVSGKRLQLIGDQDPDGTPTGDEEAFWYGKSSDIIIDVAGYVLGSYWAETYWPNAATSSADVVRQPEIGGYRTVAPSWLR